MIKLYGKCKELFFSTQLGVRTPKGVESAVHAIRAYIQNENTTDKVLLKVDFKYAFNQISRDEKLKTWYPRYTYLSTNATPQVKAFSTKGVTRLNQEREFNKVSPLSTMDFIESCKNEIKVFYLDEGTLDGDVETVLNDYKKIQTAAATLGLEVNPSKC